MLLLSHDLKIVKAVFEIPSVLFIELQLLDLIQVENDVGLVRELVLPLIRNKDAFYWIQVQESKVAT